MPRSPAFVPSNDPELDITQRLTFPINANSFSVQETGTSASRVAQQKHDLENPVLDRPPGRSGCASKPKASFPAFQLPRSPCKISEEPQRVQVPGAGARPPQARDPRPLTSRGFLRAWVEKTPLGCAACSCQMVWGIAL